MITAEVLSSLRKEYEEGANATVLAHRHGTPKQTIWRHLKKSGLFAKKITEILYCDSSVYLTRKYKKAKEILKIERSFRRSR